jgi:CheY-like chemotaxis protein
LADITDRKQAEALLKAQNDRLNQLMLSLQEQTEERQIPAIALTAYAGELDQQQALAAGFQQHLTKPIEPTVLVQTIWTLMGNKAKF